MRSLVCVILIFFAACKDDNLYGINSDTRAYLLANKKWQRSAMFVKSTQGFVIRDEYAVLPEYSKDDYIFFGADSTFEFNDNLNRDPLAPAQVLARGAWTLPSGETFIDFNTEHSFLFSDSIRITSIDAQNLMLERPVSDGVQFFAFRVIP